MLSKVEVSIPPRIAELDVELSASTLLEVRRADHRIAELQSIDPEVLRPLASLLLRSESVASSKIENLSANIEDFARAASGLKSNSSALEMVSAARAIEQWLSSVEKSGFISEQQLLRAHQQLMLHDNSERNYRGRYRDMQNWVGGSDYSPRGAVLVPPPPELVAGLMVDLFEFINRDDLPPLVQAAIAHAQFETIHPFTDGNGRIGRALMNAILLRRKASSVIIPIATALVADRDQYFSLLNSYRAGEIDHLCAELAHAARISSEESRRSADQLTLIQREWQGIFARTRSDSIVHKVLAWLPSNPVFAADDLQNMSSTAPSRVYEAIARLADAGVIRPLTERTRNQVWAVGAVLRELEALEFRVSDAFLGG